MGARVRAGSRLHFGFCTLSLAHERIYGGLGAALSEPATVVRGEPADSVECEHDAAATYARLAVDRLDVPGVRIEVEEAIPRHVGLGSGTQLALSTYAATAAAHGREIFPREAAPDLDRGGRSGIGVAAFEAGGFVLDAGHPAERFTTARPERGEWTVPAVAARHSLPEGWRFLLVLPAVDPGRSGDREEVSMRAVIESGDPGIADEIAGIVVRRLLPAAATGDLERFGRAVTEVGRLNGVWYADEQGGVYRPPVGTVVDELAASPAIAGAGQSSWGPAVYGVTDADRIEEAKGAARAALDAAGVDGDVTVARGRNRGARIDPDAG